MKKIQGPLKFPTPRVNYVTFLTHSAIYKINVQLTTKGTTIIYVPGGVVVPSSHTKFQFPLKELVNFKMIKVPKMKEM